MVENMGKRRIFIISLTVIIAVLLLIGVSWYFFYDLTRGPLPQHNGELRVEGLNDSVTILRDEWGIPHIYANNMHDLFFAQGYSHAQDRW